MWYSSQDTYRCLPSSVSMWVFRWMVMQEMGGQPL
jgi:hypothetical protein